MDARTPRERAEAEEVYRACRQPLLEQVRTWFPTLRGVEEDLYQAAWSSLLAKDRPIEDLEKYLRAAVFNAGLMELRRRRRRPIASLADARIKTGDGRRGAWQQGVDAVVDRTEPLPEEQAESREDWRLLDDLLEELTPLQRQIIKLRWGFGVPRRQTASLLGLSERSVKREMLKAAPIISSNVERALAGRWCDQRRALVIAYCLGLTGPARAAKARKHLQRCSACRELASSVRQRVERLGAVMPVPAFTVSASPAWIHSRAAELGESIRGGLTDFAGGAKAHALALLARTPGADTAASQVAVGGGLKGGGSTLAALTACLIAGSGATYCAIEGVPESLRDLTPIQRSRDERARSERAEEPDRRAPATEPPPSSAGIPEHDAADKAPASAEPKPDPPSGDPTTEAASAVTNESHEFGPPGGAELPPPLPPRSAEGEFGP